MHDVETNSPSPEFIRCWNAAGSHLQACGGSPEFRWLKATPIPPFLEHLSFALGNQLFFVRLVSKARTDAIPLVTPGSPAGLQAISAGCNGHACVMPLDEGPDGWQPVEPGWGLLHLETGKRVDPPSLATDALIEMTDWELHDFSVQVVRDSLKKEGREIMSSQGNPSVDPSIWFVGEQGPECVIVRAARHPLENAEKPASMEEITDRCMTMARRVSFASVAAVSADYDFEDGSAPVPLYRGKGMYANYKGLQLIKEV